MQHINCEKYAKEILDGVKAIPNKKKLVILSVGNDPASASYVKGKKRDCEYVGIPCVHVTIPDDENAAAELAWNIAAANMDGQVGGIIVQLPLPDGLDPDLYTGMVRFDKDVDGFHHKSPYKPCTPEGIMYLLRKEVGDLTGKNALVIGRGKLVGEPIAKMLCDADATVTIAHSKTKGIENELVRADIVISAVGKPNAIDLEWCWASDIVVDVGVNRGQDGKLCGDCFNFSSAYEHLRVTPVPKGVGLLTRAMLMAHVAGMEV